MRRRPHCRACVGDIPIAITLRPGQSAVWVHGRDISGELEGEAVGRAASAVATLPIGTPNRYGAVASPALPGEAWSWRGGTLVRWCFRMPTSSFSWMPPSMSGRGGGGWKWRQAGHGDTFDEVRQAIAARDEQDRTRTLAPLVRRRRTHTLLIRRIYLLTMSCGLWYQRRNTTSCGVTVEPACAPWP